MHNMVSTDYQLMRCKVRLLQNWTEDYVLQFSDLLDEIATLERRVILIDNFTDSTLDWKLCSDTANARRKMLEELNHHFENKSLGMRITQNRSILIIASRESLSDGFAHLNNYEVRDTQNESEIEALDQYSWLSPIG